MANAVQTIMPRWAEYHAAARRRAEAHFAKERWQEKHRRVFEQLAPV
jgi:hypothetical protein